MKKRLTATLLALLFAGVGFGQEQYNYLAIDGQAQPEAIGPYYFMQQGNSNDAFVKADLLARALGVDLVFDSSTKQLVFSHGGSSVILETTGNILQGLQTRAGTLQVDGEQRNSPMGILVEGSSYVAVSPVVAALGGSSEYDDASHVLFVDSAPPQVEATTQPDTASASSAASADRVLSAPRYGFQETSSRVAIDVPPGTPYHLFITANRLALQLEGVSVNDFHQAVNDPFLQAFYFARIGDDLALVVDTRYPLTAGGQGYRVGRLPATAERPDSDVLYLDFASDLQGEAGASLSATVTPLAEVAGTASSVTPTVPTATTPTAPTTPTVATTRAPVATKKTVVIDPGHGGKFAGAHGYVAEEDVVLQVALKLKALLERQGVTVLLTRDSDLELDPSYRADLSARGTLASPETNLFISIHANAVANGSASGVETWVFGEPLNDSYIALAIKENGGGDVGEAITQEALKDARTVMGDIVRQGQLSYSLTLAEMVQGGMVDSTGAKDRGVRQTSLQVLSQARTPAVLVEIGFVTNADEGPKLGSDGYQSSLAQGLANGILTFLNQGLPVAAR